jgi:hypothetical protein
MATLRLCLDERNTRNLHLTNVVVVFDPPPHARKAYEGTKLIPGEHYLYLGEISNMPGHGTFVYQKTGETLWGYHIENFWLSLEGVKISKGSDEFGSETVDVEDQEFEDTEEPEEE